jgi:hypothetical protein
MLKGTSRVHTYDGNGFGDTNAAFVAGRNAYHTRFGLENEKFEKFINFYTIVEQPQGVQNREDSLGIIMTWDMGLTLSLQQNSVHNQLCV